MNVLYLLLDNYPGVLVWLETDVSGSIVRPIFRVEKLKSVDV